MRADMQELDGHSPDETFVADNGYQRLLWPLKPVWGLPIFCMILLSCTSLQNPTARIHDFTIKSIASHCEVIDSVYSMKGTLSTTNIGSQLKAFRGGSGALILTSCSHKGDITIPIDPGIQ